MNPRSVGPTSEGYRVAGKGKVKTRTWTDYDPGWLVLLARAQEPDLVAMLSTCTRALVESKAYIHFVAPDAANQPGSEWQFERNVIMTDPEHGQIVLDV